MYILIKCFQICIFHLHPNYILNADLEEGGDFPCYVVCTFYLK